ncbi:MAG: cobyric acid synthase [Actinomycetota bacterium]
MIQGTNSDAGKSVLVAGLCRAYARRGLRVHPFKPQNMSNNAAAVAGGGEIGRAQALQARAAGVTATVHHNPVLLKPESDRRSQIVVQGRAVGQLDASRYGTGRAALLEPVLDSFDTVAADADLVLIEGAGSPAETNLRAGDIANMGFARAAGVPVILAGDIDRGGVIASLVGTAAVLSDDDRAHVKGFVINKFRGEVSLFADGLATVTERTGWPSFGVVTWSRSLAALPAEDAVVLERSTVGGISADIHVAVPMLSRIANFDDLDPLRLEPDVTVTMVPPGRPIPVADLVILPGTKATIADLAFLRSQGWDVDLAAHVRRGGRVLGLCGGYQLLGRTIADPDGAEGPPGTVDGLGLLAVDTVLVAGDKVTRPVDGVHAASGRPVAGYEIHIGRTEGPDTARPWVRLGDPTGAGMADGPGAPETPGVPEAPGVPEGATSPDGAVAGTYVHGVFTDDGFRAAFLRPFRNGGPVEPGPGYDATVEAALDAWADQLADELDLDGLLSVARAGLATG